MPGRAGRRTLPELESLPADQQRPQVKHGQCVKHTVLIALGQQKIPSAETTSLTSGQVNCEAGWTMMRPFTLPA